MTENMAKSRRELNSLWGLSIMNIVIGGLVMAFGISIGVENVSFLIEAQSILFPQIVYASLGFVAAGISLRWLVSSAEILDGADELRTSYSKKQSLDEESSTGAIVEMAAYYRENRPTIKMMIMLSRIAGVCFIISGTLSLATLARNVITGIPQLDLGLQVLATALSFAMAIASFTLPHLFGKYSKIWDFRLEQAARAETELRNQIGEDEE